VETLKAIQNRNSVAHLTEPAPTTEEMEQVYKGALRAPDHAWLRPWKYIEIRGNSRNRLADAFLKASISLGEEVTDELKEKLQKAPFRAPMVIVLAADIKEHPKVPKIEQIISLGASAQNILLGLHDIGYSAIWRTGKMAFNKHITDALELPTNYEVIGYLYVGTPSGHIKSLPEIDLSDHLTIWD
jgi:nitroreductase